MPALFVIKQQQALVRKQSSPDVPYAVRKGAS